MKTFEYYFWAVVAKLILSHSYNLSQTLQKANILAAAGQDVQNLLWRSLFLCNLKKTSIYFGKLQLATNDLDISEPQVIEKYKDNMKLVVLNGSLQFHQKLTIHYEGLDLIVSCIRNHFYQPGYTVYHNLLEILLKASIKRVCLCY